MVSGASMAKLWVIGWLLAANFVAPLCALPVSRCPAATRQAAFASHESRPCCCGEGVCHCGLTCETCRASQPSSEAVPPNVDSSKLVLAMPQADASLAVPLSTFAGSARTENWVSVAPADHTLQAEHIRLQI